MANLAADPKTKLTNFNARGAKATQPFQTTNERTIARKHKKIASSFGRLRRLETKELVVSKYPEMQLDAKRLG